MGNCAISTRSSSYKSSSLSSAQVILPTREVRNLKEETKAAELMMEFTSYFLVNSASMQIGRRFSALSADEDLEIGNIYVMFPMRKMNSNVVHSDVAVLLMAAKMKMVVDENDDQDEEEGEKSKRDEHMGSVCNLEELDGSVVNDFKYRVSVCRSMEPKLKTIKEEVIY